MQDTLSDSDRAFFKQQAFLVQDDPSKSFLLHFTDQACRSTDLKRCISQLQFLIHHYGLSAYFTFFEKIKLTFFSWFGAFFPQISQ